MLLLLSILFMILAAVGSPCWKYYIFYIGAPAIILLLRKTHLRDDLLMSGMPVFAYFVFELIQGYYLRFLNKEQLDAVTAMEYLSVFLCLAECVQILLLIFGTSHLIDRWRCYCLSGMIISMSKNMSFMVQVDLNPVYGYRTFEFWGFFCFLCASALIIFPNTLVFNEKKIKGSVRSLAVMVPTAVLIAIIEMYIEYQKTEPVKISLMIFTIIIIMICGLVIVSNFRRALKKINENGVWLDELDRSDGCKPVIYKNNDFYSEYLSSRLIYRRDTAQRIMDIQDKLNEIMSEIDSLNEEIGSEPEGSRNYKRIRLRSLCIQQYDLLEELNNTYNMSIDIADNRL